MRWPLAKPTPAQTDQPSVPNRLRMYRAWAHTQTFGCKTLNDLKGKEGHPEITGPLGRKWLGKAGIAAAHFPTLSPNLSCLLHNT